MKYPFTLTIAALIAAPLQAEVEYACVVQPSADGYRLHAGATGSDFSAAFTDFAPEHDGTKSDNATFGAPRWLAVRIDGMTYLIQVDNQYGVFTLHRAEKRGQIWKRTQGTREIYHPELYDRLRAAGLNIHTTKELRAMSRDARRKALSGSDSPIRQTKNTP